MVAAPQLLAAIAAKRDSSLGFGQDTDRARVAGALGAAAPDRADPARLVPPRERGVFAGGFESIGHVGVAAAFLGVVGIGSAMRDPLRRPLAIALAVLAVHRRGVGARASHAGVHVRVRLAPRVRSRPRVGPLARRDRVRRRDRRGVGGRCNCNDVDEAVGGADRRRRGSVRARCSGSVRSGVSDLPDRWTVLSWLAVAAVVIAALFIVERTDGSARVALLVVAAASRSSWSPLARYSVIDETTTSTAFDDRSPGVAGELRDRPGLTIAFTNDEFADIAYLVAGFRPNTNALAEVAVTRRLRRRRPGHRSVRGARRPARARSSTRRCRCATTCRSRGNRRTRRRSGVRWVLIDPTRDVATQLPGWRRTELAGGGFEVWENPAWVGDAVGRLADGTEVALELDRRSPTELEVQVTDPSPMRVIVHRQIAPGWIARVDGEAADIVDADGFFLGVDVPSGTRTVVFCVRTAMAQTVARR